MLNLGCSAQLNHPRLQLVASTCTASRHELTDKVLAASKVKGLQPGSPSQSGIVADERVAPRVLEAEVSRLDVPVQNSQVMTRADYLEHLLGHKRQRPLV